MKFHRRGLPFVAWIGVILLVALACSGPIDLFSAGKPPTPVDNSLPTGLVEPSQQPGRIEITATQESIALPVEFTEADCACGELKISKAFPWGESLECRYDWAGANVDDNLLGFQLTRYYHLDQWPNRFMDDSQKLKAEFQDQPSDVQVNEFLTGAESYGFMETRPGWTRENQVIPACGYGKTEEMYAGEWLILTDLRSCEIPNDMDGYIEQLTTLQTCARNLVDKKSK